MSPLLFSFLSLFGAGADCSHEPEHRTEVVSVCIKSERKIVQVCNSNVMTGRIVGGLAGAKLLGAVIGLTHPSCRNETELECVAAGESVVKTTEYEHWQMACTK